MARNTDNINKQQAWKEVIELSYQLLTLAKQKDWQQFKVAQEQRDRLLKDYLTENKTEKENKSLTEVIEDIQEINHQIHQLLIENRNSTMGDMKKIKNGEKAKNTYKSYE